MDGFMKHTMLALEKKISVVTNRTVNGQDQNLIQYLSLNLDPNSNI